MSFKRAFSLRGLLIHTLFWVFWVVVPFLFSMVDGRMHTSIPPDYYYRTVFTMVLFYVNYLWLIDKALFNRKILVYIAINLGLVLLFIAFEVLRHELTSPDFNSYIPRLKSDHSMMISRRRPPYLFMLTGMFFSYVFAISIAIAIKATTRWFMLDAQRKSLENENLKSELSNLKMQLNPHFFFNTLNNIYSLIQLSPDKAQDAVHRLAKLMRYHLYETNSDTVPLKGELDFLESYVALMKLRTGANMKVNFSYSVEDDGDMIAPLLFVPLVENAFKYGASSDSNSVILIHVNEENHVLEVKVENSVFVNPEALDAHGGIGLDNLQKRLRLIYPERYSFDAGLHGEMFVVNLVIRL
ncbi:sensor histidine kinase [Geofilum sp. OHC36d9]|uniref:sensor histidine kinase n=1 Tax=Geofilum sp. OHC36d9 TaxID=3458413 RepID=UPI004034B1BF